MRRQLLVNGSLLALALGSLGVVWATRDAPTTSELAARKDKLFPDWSKQAVTRIELRRPGAKLELVRNTGSDVDGDFRIVAPWPERADIATVSSLLGSLELATALRGADAPPPRTPGLEIRLEMAKKSLILALGEAAPAPAGARYARVRLGNGESRTYVLSQGLVSELDVAFDKFREPRLLDYGKSDIRELTLDSERGHSRLLQRAGWFFIETAHGNELSERASTERIVAALARLASERFIEPEQARTALARGAVKVVLRPRSGPDVTITLGGTCPSAPEQSVALREQPERGAKAGCVPSELVEALRVAPSELTSSAPFSSRLDEVEELQLVEGGASLDLARKDRGFVMRAPRPSDVDLDAGNQLISTLLNARGERPATPRLKELGLEAPIGRVTLRLASEGEPRLEQVTVGLARADGTRCVKRDADQVVLCLDAQSSRAFGPQSALVKSRELLAVAPSELLSFSLVSSNQSQRVVRNSDGSYTLAEPQGFRHDGALVADVAQALGTLHAERWLSAEDDGSHGFASPYLRAKLELAKAGPARELVVGSRTRDGYFAQLLPDPGVFVLARSELEPLEQLLIDRTLCPFEAAALARIELDQGARRITLTHSGEAWLADGLEPGRAQVLAETVVALRAERALHLGPAKPSEGLARPSLVVRYADEQGKRRQLSVGARTSIDGEELAFARLDGVDASFVLALETVRALQAF